MHDGVPSIDDHAGDSPTAEYPVSVTHQGAPRKDFDIFFAKHLGGIPLTEIERRDHWIKLNVEC